MTDPTRRDFLVQAAGALSALAIVPDTRWSPPRRQARALTVGVIGAGRQGRDILDELAKIDAAQVTAVCDLVESRAVAGAERAPGSAPFADHRALLDARPAIQAIVVATPTHTHRTIALDALNAGRHVYCEAPLAATVEDCRAIAAAAEAAPDRVFHVGLQARSNPIYRRARTLVRAGSLRTLVAARAQDHRKTSWRFPAPDAALERAFNWKLDPDVSIGMAGELGTSQFDVLSWFRGRAPVRVAGTGEVRHYDDGRSIADTVHASLTWDDGVTLDYDATLASSYGGRFEELYGSNASMRLAWKNGWLFKEADAPTEGWEVYATRQQFHDDEGIVLVADATRLASQGRIQEGLALEHPSLYYALADFVRSATEGTEVACSAADGAQATIVGILANQAIASGTAVEVPASN
jgi:predicted dehydrogenase